MVEPAGQRELGLWAVPAIAGLVLAACGPGLPTASDTLDAYFDAVQSHDVDALYCLSTGAADTPDPAGGRRTSRETFEAWVQGEYDAYLEGRDRGLVPLEDSGVRVVQLFSLGRGTFFTYGPVVHPGSGALAVETALRFGYGNLDLSGFSPGTTLYFAAAPAGRVVAVRVPQGSDERSAEVLDELVLRWTLVRSPAGEECPARWTVASVEPIEDSEVTEEITWTF